MSNEWQVTFESNAEWRRNVADRYPDDRRNLEAAEIFERLAKTVEVCPNEVVTLFDDLPDSEDLSELQREVGFYFWPSNAEEFLREFIKRRTSGRR